MEGGGGGLFCFISQLRESIYQGMRYSITLSTYFISIALGYQTFYYVNYVYTYNYYVD